jgi:hypothetical protein
LARQAKSRFPIPKSAIISRAAAFSVLRLLANLDQFHAEHDSPRGETTRRRLPFQFLAQAFSLPNFTAMSATGLRAVVGWAGMQNERLPGFDSKCLAEQT